jgi:hypothetical protein
MHVEADLQLRGVTLSRTIYENWSPVRKKGYRNKMNTKTIYHALYTKKKKNKRGGQPL